MGAPALNSPKWWLSGRAEFGADRDRRAESGATAVFSACADGRAEIFNALARLEVDIDLAAGAEQTSPLHAACFAGGHGRQSHFPAGLSFSFRMIHIK